MSKIFISRPHGSVSWGFRLQGGLEYNEPLTVTNIVPDSPADGKIDPGDMLIEIAGNNATYMTHQDALELIQRCANALFLTVYKIGFSYPPGSNQPQPAPITTMRRPAGQQQQQQFNYQQQPSYGYGQPPASVYNTVPPTFMPVANIPPAPIFDADLIANSAASLKSHQSVFANHSTTEISNIPAVLAKSLSRPGGPKPFSYTPGGLDLSKIRESARVRRHRECISDSEETNNIREIDQIMSRRMIVPSEKMSQHHYAGTNPIQPFSYARQQPTAPTKYPQHDTDAITQSRSFQMLQGWISDSEKLVPTLAAAPPSPSATTISNRSAVVQAVLDHHTNFRRRASSGGTSTLPSRSFRYLQEQYNDDNLNNNTITSIPTNTVEERRLARDGSGGLRRSSNAHTPSRSFRYLQDQYDTSDQLSINRSQPVNNRNDLMEIYHKPPPSFRAREPEAPRYSGSTVPSRSFRFLQMMTQEDEQNNSQPVAGYTKPQQLLLLNKYDEQTLLSNINRLNDHPSRSFKYLQEMTGEQQQKQQQQQPTGTERTTNGGQSFNTHHIESHPIVTTSSKSLINETIRNYSKEIDGSDF